MVLIFFPIPHQPLHPSLFKRLCFLLFSFSHIYFFPPHLPSSPLDLFFFPILQYLLYILILTLSVPHTRETIQYYTCVLFHLRVWPLCIHLAVNVYAVLKNKSKVSNNPALSSFVDAVFQIIINICSNNIFLIKALRHLELKGFSFSKPTFGNNISSRNSIPNGKDFQAISLQHALSFNSKGRNIPPSPICRSGGF